MAHQINGVLVHGTKPSQGFSWLVQRPSYSDVVALIRLYALVRYSLPEIRDRVRRLTTDR